MDEAGWITHWRDVYSGLLLLGDSGERRRAKPTSDHLDRLEGVFGCRLPASYRAFVQVLGPGHLAVSFTIFAPGYRGAGVVDFLSNNKWQKHISAERDDLTLTSRLIAFASFLGDYQPFCWDTSEVTDSIAHEYRIVHLPRDADAPPLRVADSFGSFIEEHCLGGGFWRLLGYEEEQTAVDEETGEPRSIRFFDPVGRAPNSRL